MEVAFRVVPALVEEHSSCHGILRGGTGRRRMERKAVPERDGAVLPTFKTLEAFRANPKDSWTMADVERLCSELGLSCIPPSGGGSHYKIKSGGSVRWILTIPKARPIKPPYIRNLVQFADEHLAAIREKDTNDER